MPELVIESFPEALHEKLRRIAAANHRTVAQETIHLIEMAVATEEQHTPVARESGTSYWAKRKLLPEWEQALKEGAFQGGTDSTQIISEDRDAR